MRLKHQWGSVLVAAMLGRLVSVTAVAVGEQFLPVLVTREGAVRSFQAPRADGYIAYLTLLNERDGGINRVKLSGKSAKPFSTPPAPWSATSA
jgi:branched-chain amino acid transport system substrate-binding protein